MTSSTTPRLEFTGVTVDFGATRALHDLSGRIAPGEVVGLLGHNGAGKSTLFNVLGGVVRPTSGGYLLDGEPVPAGITPREVAALGITILHQEPALAANLTVEENLWLTQPAPSRADRRTAARAALDRVGCDLDLDTPVASLGLGQRQLVALARGLVGREMRVLLLDEPTAALGQADTEALHRLIRRFAADGVAVVYVSHRLPDILDVCERILILSGGALVADETASHFTPRRLARALAPDLADSEFAPAETGAVGLEVRHGTHTLSFREGEVVGLFGMAGGAQYDLVEAVYGLRGRFSITAGESIEVAHPRGALRRGIHLVPGDRERDGLVSGLSASENVFLPWYRRAAGRGWWISGRNTTRTYERARAALNILGPDAAATIDQFSGGNRQKHLLARWMFAHAPRVLLLAQPTQGVDVGAKADIVRAVRDLARAGTTVVVASAESDEIAGVCDRAYVLLGDQVAELDRTPSFDEHLLATLLELADRAPQATGSEGAHA